MLYTDTSAHDGAQVTEQDNGMYLIPPCMSSLMARRLSVLYGHVHHLPISLRRGLALELGNRL